MEIRLEAVGRAVFGADGGPLLGDVTPACDSAAAYREACDIAGLWAAAPDMLRALDAVMGAFNFDGNLLEPDQGAAMALVHIAVTKARGDS